MGETLKDYKKCPHWGQSEIPFKMGICVCGRQVSNIQYIKNPKRFAQNYYYDD